MTPPPPFEVKEGASLFLYVCQFCGVREAAPSTEQCTLLHHEQRTAVAQGGNMRKLLQDSSQKYEEPALFSGCCAALEKTRGRLVVNFSVFLRTQVIQVWTWKVLFPAAVIEGEIQNTFKKCSKQQKQTLTWQSWIPAWTGITFYFIPPSFTTFFL